jgi:hypothetical protein
MLALRCAACLAQFVQHTVASSKTSNNIVHVCHMPAGLAEITRLAVAKGANPLTMGGLAGMGDLVLTCTGDMGHMHAVAYTVALASAAPQLPGMSACDCGRSCVAYTDPTFPSASLPQQPLCLQSTCFCTGS